jgi:hypothetical protein
MTFGVVGDGLGSISLGAGENVAIRRYIGETCGCKKSLCSNFDFVHSFARSRRVFYRKYYVTRFVFEFESSEIDIS